MAGKYILPAPEEIDTECLYSFSLSPEVQPEGNTVGRFTLNSFKTYSHDIEKRMSELHNCEYELVHEISRQGRWHFHGYISIKNVMLFYLYDLPKIKHIGTFEIDTIGDVTKWHDYVYKQSVIMRRFALQEGFNYVVKSPLRSKQAPKGPGF